jgi:lipopolysaccharide/colanic/teichoic acid biosynthesis glycosyltransferase
MNNARLPSGELAPDDQRLTAVGRWLRRTSIDELPQVWNVLTGSMSLIGPRPLPRQYDALYSGPQRVRLLARPGITGLSQVTLRNAGDWKDKLALDTQYVTTASLRLDLSILARTVTAVVSGRGVSASGHVTMPEFTGDTPEPG